MNSDELIRKLLEGDGRKPPGSVLELYLGSSKLESVKSLARFINLQRLWLNSNQLRNLNLPDRNCSFIKFNYRLTELHLQSNEINTITGVLSHLHCLKVLMLQNNQLANLKEAMNELKTINTLQKLNLFGNPISFDEGYRLYVVFSLPSVQMLDRSSVSHPQRVRAQQTFNSSYNKVQGTIGFLTRTLLAADEKQIDIAEFDADMAESGTPRKKVRFILFCLLMALFFFLSMFSSYVCISYFFPVSLSLTNYVQILN